MVLLFAPSSNQIPRSRSVALSASLLCHGLLLAWLLHPPSARVLAPSSVAAGEYGPTLTHLYWPSHSLREDTSAAATSNSLHSAARKLIWKKLKKAQPPGETDVTAASDQTEAQASAANSSAPPPPAGMPYGTASGGAALGDEIRPALPISATDPIVDSHDLAGYGEGSVIVEVTIDYKGNVVQKVVLQSLGPLIDNKVLAALESWHFLPATRNGVAIPSKQDVYYHFKPNG